METADHPTEGSRIELVPSVLVPTTVLYEIAYQSGASASWRSRGRTVPVDVFGSMLMDSGDASFAIVDRGREGAIVGFIGLYNFDPPSMVASMSTFVDLRRADASYIAGAAIHLFSRYVFETIGLRKMMVETPASRSGYMRGALDWSPVATHEGTLRDHARLGAMYEDIELYAIWGDRYLDRYCHEPTIDPIQLERGSAFDLVRGGIEDLVPLPDGGLTGGHLLVADLGLDSLSLLELIDGIEAKTGHQVRLEPVDLEALTVQFLIQAIESSG